MGCGACWCRPEHVSDADRSNSATVTVYSKESPLLGTHAEPKVKYVIARTEKAGCMISEEQKLPLEREVQEFDKE